MMRKVSAIFMFLLLFASGCQSPGINKTMTEIDSLIVAELRDSAYHLVKSMDESVFHAPEDVAHFNLLKVQTAYLVNQPLSFSDSILDNVISFYEQHPDNEKLAEAYYYRAVSTNAQQDYQRSIILYKKAEKRAEASGNKRLQFKIAECLTFVNGMCFNFDLQLIYAKRSLELAQKLGRKDLVAYSYYRVAFAYSQKGYEDSAHYYSSLIMPYMDSVGEQERPVLLSSLGYMLRLNNPKQAKEYLRQSLSYEELTTTYMYLAEISYNEGKLGEAYYYWKKGLRVHDATPKDNIIHNMIEYDMERGKTDSICEMVTQIIAIRDSIDAKLKNDTIKDLQTRFDHEVAMREKDQMVIRWQWIAMILVVLLLAGLLYYLFKKYQTKIRLQNSQMQINDYMEQIRTLQSEKGDRTAEIERLNKQIERIMEEKSPRLAQGRILYDEVVANKMMNRWKKDDVKKFIEYYTATNYRVVNRLRNIPRREKLTPNHLLYLILREMGKADQQICLILNISKASLRTLRHRTKPFNEEDSEKSDQAL